MNRFSFIYLLIFFIQNTVVASCPTCVAKVEPNSPPFFVDEFYTACNDDFDKELLSTGTGSL